MLCLSQAESILPKHSSSVTMFISRLRAFQKHIDCWSSLLLVIGALMSVLVFSFFFFLACYMDALSSFSISSLDHSCLLPSQGQLAFILSSSGTQLEKIISLEDREALNLDMPIISISYCQQTSDYNYF